MTWNPLASRRPTRHVIPGRIASRRPTTRHVIPGRIEKKELFFNSDPESTVTITGKCLDSYGIPKTDHATCHSRQNCIPNADHATCHSRQNCIPNADHATCHSGQN
ncbi:hypothetical protein QUF72_22285 [Desulfobacterales bacterium HSG2]|nr:hypothetical protein [Desulfobacterales bacterium HSG2]